MAEKLQHSGVLGMKWGRRKRGVGTDGKALEVGHGPAKKETIFQRIKRDTQERRAKLNADEQIADKLGEKYRQESSKARDKMTFAKEAYVTGRLNKKGSDAMYQAGKDALKKAATDFDTEFSKIDSFKITTGEKIASVVFTAAAIGAIVYAKSLER